MKTGVFAILNLVVAIALLVSGGASPKVAESQMAGSLEPAPNTVPSPFGGKAGEPAAAPAHAEVTTALQGTPMMFIENVGQFDEHVRFQVRGGDRTLWLAEEALWITALEAPTLTPGPSSYDEKRSTRLIPSLAGSETGLGSEGKPRQGVTLKLSFVGANPAPHIEPFDKLDGRVSYLVGSDPDQWRADVPVWGGVRYVDLYPGVDLELYSADDATTWRLICRTADCQSALQHIRLRVEGADTLAVDGDRLRLSTELGEYTLPLLQMVGASVPSLAPPTVTGDQVAWPFVAPTSNMQSTVRSLQSGALLYGTFVGGINYDFGRDIAVDAAGCAYVTGETGSGSLTFPTTPGAFDTTYNGGDRDVFVVKLNADGTGLAYGTYLGGGDYDYGYGIAVDAAGSACVTGYTRSDDFPTTPGAFDTIHGGGRDVFVVKLNADGTGLAYATFLGGGIGEGIALDGAGSAYVTGRAGAGFPTTPGAFDTVHNGGYDAFVAKLDADGAGLTYATFLGGSGSDYGESIALDGAGSAYVTGYTSSDDFPTTPGAFDTTYHNLDDAFVVKLNADGTGLAYATYLGGNGSDLSNSIAVDTAGSAYVAGDTHSDDFPTTPGAFDTVHDHHDVFVVKLNADGTGLAYATLLGEGGENEGWGIAVDAAGCAYVTGYTNAYSFPTTPGAFDTSYNGGDWYEYSDTYVVKLNADGTGLAYGTFLGGSDNETGRGIAVDASGSAYVTGYTYSTNFPTTPGAFDTTNSGDTDAFVVKFRLELFQIYLPLVVKG